MVVGHTRKLAVPCARFVQPLRQGNTGWYAKCIHLQYGKAFVFIDVLERSEGGIAVVSAAVFALDLPVVLLCYVIADGVTVCGA